MFQFTGYGTSHSLKVPRLICRVVVVNGGRERSWGTHSKNYNTIRTFESALMNWCLMRFGLPKKEENSIVSYRETSTGIIIISSALLPNPGMWVNPKIKRDLIKYPEEMTFSWCCRRIHFPPDECILITTVPSSSAASHSHLLFYSCSRALFFCVYLKEVQMDVVCIREDERALFMVLMGMTSSTFILLSFLFASQTLLIISGNNFPFIRFHIFILLSVEGTFISFSHVISYSLNHS